MRPYWAHAKAIAALFAALTLVACGGRSVEYSAPIPQNASFRLTFAGYQDAGNDFTGNYVQVVGSRTAADAKYPCASTSTTCMPLAASGMTDSIDDLCPTINYPVSDWTFTFDFFTDAQCSSKMSNIACPTMTTKLDSGANTKKVVCTTRNAEPSFDFCIYDPVSGAGSTCVGPNKVSCWCKDGAEHTVCSNIDCSSGPAQDTVCNPVCDAHGGLNATGCLANDPFCS